MRGIFLGRGIRTYGYSRLSSPIDVIELVRLWVGCCDSHIHGEGYWELWLQQTVITYRCHWIGKIMSWLWRSYSWGGYQDLWLQKTVITYRCHWIGKIMCGLWGSYSWEGIRTYGYIRVITYRCHWIGKIMSGLWRSFPGEGIKSYGYSRVITYRCHWIIKDYEWVMKVIFWGVSGPVVTSDCHHH